MSDEGRLVEYRTKPDGHWRAGRIIHEGFYSSQVKDLRSGRYETVPTEQIRVPE